MQALSPSLPDLGCQLQDPKPPNPDPGPVKTPAHPGVHCAPRPSALWRLGPDSPMTLFSLLVCGLTDGSTCLSVPWGHCECLQPVTFRGANEILRGRAQHHARHTAAVVIITYVSSECSYFCCSFLASAPQARLQHRGLDPAWLVTSWPVSHPPSAPRP